MALYARIYRYCNVLNEHLPPYFSLPSIFYILYALIIIDDYTELPLIPPSRLSTGMNALAYDPSKFAVDYHNMGFQECAAEVARYLVTAEGLDIQDPLRMRLMSHLQDYAAQKDLASKQTPWYPSGPPPSNVPNASQPYQPNSPLLPIGGTHHLPRPPPLPIPIPPPPSGLLHNTSLNSSSGSSLNSSIGMNSSHMSSSSNSHSLNSSYENQASGCETAVSSQSVTSAPTITPLVTVSSTMDSYNYIHQNNHQHPSMDLYHHPQHMHQQHGYNQGTPDSAVSPQMKPYRPWGAELAY